MKIGYDSYVQGFCLPSWKIEKQEEITWLVMSHGERNLLSPTFVIVKSLRW